MWAAIIEVMNMKDVARLWCCYSCWRHDTRSVLHFIT